RHHTNPLQRLFPQLEIEKFRAEADWCDAEHVCELIAPLAAERRPPGTARFGAAATDSPCPEAGAPISGWPALLQLPALAALNDSLRQLHDPNPDESLSPALAEKLYGPALKTSVSALEHFAACPFKFFVHSGLRAEERKFFEADARERGSFQHEALKRYHEGLRQEDKEWRDLTPQQARERMGRVAEQLAVEF